MRTICRSRRFGPIFKARLASAGCVLDRRVRISVHIDHSGMELSSDIQPSTELNPAVTLDRTVEPYLVRNPACRVSLRLNTYADDPNGPYSTLSHLFVRSG